MIYISKYTYNIDTESSSLIWTMDQVIMRN